MTKTREILLAMIADGKPRTNATLREEFGLTSNQASTILRALVKGGYVNIAPIAYTLSDAGCHHIKNRTAQNAAALEKKSAYMRERRRATGASQRRRSEFVDAAPVNTNTLIASGMRSRTALDMAWGATLGAREGAGA